MCVLATNSINQSGSPKSFFNRSDARVRPRGPPNQHHVTVIKFLIANRSFLVTIYFCRNCVATVDLHTPLDLQIVNARTRNTEYNPSRFHGVIMRIREPRTTALIFKTGKIVCTGARNEHDALLASKKFARIIQKLGFNVGCKCFSLYKK